MAKIKENELPHERDGNESSYNEHDGNERKVHTITLRFGCIHKQ